MKSKVHFMKTLIALFLSITVYFTSSGLMEVGASHLYISDAGNIFSCKLN